MKTKHLFLFFLFSISLIWGKWEFISGKYVTIYYPHAYYSQAEALLMRLEYYRGNIELYTGYNNQPINVVLQDNGLDTGGSYFTFPERMTLHPVCPQSFDWVGTRDFYTLLAVHELTHQLHLSQTSNQCARAVALFGTSFYSNTFVPVWFSEGLAVLVESSIDPYSGRLNDGYFDTVLATLFQTGHDESIAEWGSPYSEYLFGHKPYVYGASFLSFLEKTYGKESLIHFIEQQGRTVKGVSGLLMPQLGFDKTAQQVFGNSFKTIYEEWKEDTINQSVSFKLPKDTLTQTKGRKKFLCRVDDTLYYVQTHFLEPEPHRVFTQSTLMTFNVNTNQSECVALLGSSVESPLQYSDGALYFLMSDITFGFDNYANAGYGGITKLMKFDCTTSRLTELSRGAIRSFYVKEDHSFILIKEGAHVNSQDCYVIYNKREQYVGSLAAQLSEWVCVDDVLYCIAKKPNQSWNLYRFDETSIALIPCIETPYSISNLKAEAHALLLTSNQDGYAHLYRFIPTQQIYQRLSQSDGILEGVVHNNSIYGISFFGDGEELFTEVCNDVTYAIVPEVPFQNNMPTLSIDIRTVTIDTLSSETTLYSKYIPYLVAGNDVLSRLSYSVSYSATDQFVFDGVVRYFSPFQLGVKATSQFGYGFIDVPMYRSAGFGLTGVTPRLLYNSDLGAFLTSTITVDVPWLKTVFEPGVMTRQPGSSLYTRIMWYQQDYSATLTSSLFTTYPARSFIRGFENSVYLDESGTVASLDIKKRIATLRKIWWSPYIGVGDIYFDVFYDYSSLYEGDGAWGYELQMESLVGLHSDYLNLTPRFGMSYSGDQTAFYGFLDMKFSF